MSGKPYRLAADAAGGRMGRLIRRDEPLPFNFDRDRLSGFAGDTLASALLANGVRLIARSFKYHRPRGLMGHGSEEANGLVQLGTGGRQEPNLRATQIELFDGLVAQSQNRWPNLAFDIGQINSLASRLLPSGFYYKTFMWPQKMWPTYEHVIRMSAGLGRAAKERDPDIYEHLDVSCDVLVVGAGPAGIAAALAASASGARVIMADENPQMGGVLDCSDGEIAGADPLNWVRSSLETLAGADNVHLLTRTTVAGHFHHNWVLMAERVSDHNPDFAREGTPRHRLWRVRAREIVLATGAIERPLVFANNDRPGIMLASAARAYMRRYGVAPGRRGVIFTNNDDAYLTALDLAAAGVTVPRILDTRGNPSGPLVTAARKAGIEIAGGQVIVNVETSFGGSAIEGVRVSGFRPSGRLSVSDERIECDFICASGGYNPVVHLWKHTSGTLRFDNKLQALVPDTTDQRMRVAGSANGAFELGAILKEGFDAGEAAASDALGAKPRASARAQAPAAKSPRRGPVPPVWFIPSVGARNEGNKHFVDYQSDVTIADLELAAREGYSSVEHLKRYTTLGMATDQGKTSSVNGLAILADIRDAAIPEVGTTTYRPPYTPISMGAIAGTKARNLFQPVRRTPITDWHMEKGAHFEPVGLWRRPYCYPHGTEEKRTAINREILLVRNRVGIIDASTLGKVEIKGPDAATFLDRMYTNTFSTLKVGRCRYGLMCNEDGFLFDDGVTVRLDEDHYLMHTTSGNSDRVHAWLEEWLQTEWPDLKVFVTPVTEQWAQFAVAGPKARDVIEKLGSDIDFSGNAFPMLSMKRGELGGFPVRVFRISFSGELSYEIATPAGHGRALWQALLGAGEDFGIGAYGTEALHVLRAEKGFIAIGDETDGTVTPFDLDLGWAVSKKKADFIGKHSMQRSFLAGPDRKELVGLLTESPKTVLPDGAYAVDEVKKEPPMTMIGQVTSSYHSPTLGRSIAMGLIRNGRARMGQTISFPLKDKVVRAKIVSPMFYDEKGARQDG